jgi:hypothetical protein
MPHSHNPFPPPSYTCAGTPYFSASLSPFRLYPPPFTGLYTWPRIPVHPYQFAASLGYWQSQSLCFGLSLFLVSLSTTFLFPRLAILAFTAHLSSLPSQSDGISMLSITHDLSGCPILSRTWSHHLSHGHGVGGLYLGPEGSCYRGYDPVLGPMTPDWGRNYRPADQPLP